jgi:hypothetical protein
MVHGLFFGVVINKDNNIELERILKWSWADQGMVPAFAYSD